MFKDKEKYKCFAPLQSVKRFFILTLLCIFLGGCSVKHEGFVIGRHEDGNRFWLTIELEDGTEAEVEVNDVEYIGYENGDTLIVKECGGSGYEVAR